VAELAFGRDEDQTVVGSIVDRSNHERAICANAAIAMGAGALANMGESN
jgi:hypothetical protein